MNQNNFGKHNIQIQHMVAWGRLWNIEKSNHEQE